MENLKTIENRLVSLVEIDKKNWTQFYLLLKRVEDEGLWQEENKSFTAWVKNFSMKHKIHETIIWNRKKAGKVYESYVKIKAEQGETVSDIADINVSVDSLVLLDKINKHSEETASKLVDKVMNKTITKKDLREVYKSIRPETISKNPHEQKNIKVSTDDETNKITANDIITTICNIEWLGEKPERKYFKSSFEQNKHRVFAEFPVHTGTSKHSRLIDALLVENITTEKIWDLNLHAIEIKVSKSDLINDNKYTEYADFADYLWLAIPGELLEDALKTKPKSCGIIVVDNNAATIAEQAGRLDAHRRVETLTSIALKTI